MKEIFLQFLIDIYKAVPQNLLYGLLSALCLGGVVIISCYGYRCGWRKIVWLILAEYVFLLYCSTVIFRTAADGNGHEFTPFWSYEAIEDGRSELLAENIMNVVVFVPVGLMLGFVTQKTQKGLWRTRIARIALIIGAGLIISVSIEVMQYFFHRGFAETDDVMHNTIGCILGYILVQGSRLMVHGFCKDKRL